MLGEVRRLALCVLAVAVVGCTGSKSEDAAHVCRSAFGTKLVNSAVGTVGEVRGVRIGSDFSPQVPNAFPGAANGEPAVWCWVLVGKSAEFPGSTDYKSWAIGPHGKRLMVVEQTANKPPYPGVPIIP
jgi:hypothetical protein